MLLVVGLIALALFGLWWRGYFDVSDPESEAAAEPVFWMSLLDKATPIEADVLLRAYEEDLAEANRRFDRKVLAVRGVVSEVSTVKLSVEVAGTGRRNLHCALQGREAERLADVQEGDTLTIAGLCVGLGRYDDDVHLRRCRFRE